MDARILAFVGVAALLTISPGPDMALMLRNVLRGGRRVVVPTAIGTCSGLLVWGATSAIGITAVVAASAQLYLILRLAGAAYLVLLGLSALRSAIRASHGPIAPAANGPRLTRKAALGNGLMTNLLNPKIGVFYATLLPQFIPPGTPVFATSMLLAGIHAGLGLVWLAIYGTTLASFGERLMEGRLRRTIEAATGGVLVALGIGVAVEVR